MNIHKARGKKLCVRANPTDPIFRADSLFFFFLNVTCHGQFSCVCAATRVRVCASGSRKMIACQIVYAAVAAAVQEARCCVSMCHRVKLRFVRIFSC